MTPISRETISLTLLQQKHKNFQTIAKNHSKAKRCILNFLEFCKNFNLHFSDLTYTNKKLNFS
jgi:hypothetical protein